MIEKQKEKIVDFHKEAWRHQNSEAGCPWIAGEQRVSGGFETSP